MKVTKLIWVTQDFSFEIINDGSRPSFSLVHPVYCKCSYFQIKFYSNDVSFALDEVAMKQQLKQLFFSTIITRFYLIVFISFRSIEIYVD